MTESLALRLAISLGIGLLIGVERERRKGEGSDRAPAGIRTFALASLAGGLSLAFGGEAVLVATALVIGALIAVGYGRSRGRDPGLTTEVALVTTVLLGALAVREPGLASGLAVGVVALLASRSRLHRFVRRVLTEQELHDAIIFAAAALVILPLTPDRPIGPLGVLNPRTLWRLAVIFMAISGSGYIALRALGPGIGLSVSGFVSGFVSSSATIAAMGARARDNVSVRPAAVAGAVLSTVATFVQLTALLAATSRPTLSAIRWPLVFAGAAAVAYALAFAIRGVRSRSGGEKAKGRAFRLPLAVVFAATVSLATLASAGIHQWLGDRGLLLATAVAGFADAHAAAIAAASLVAAGKVAAPEAVLPILAGLTTNTVTKVVLAVLSRDRAYALEVIPGLLAVIGAAWAALLLA
ncbi:MAG TPA: DUF4010 domain-containing protein [Thermoanaerobaculia bacterium]|nr:DUF4010 domain-containing protein [Thermoanaerobaculia bacterium]